MPQSQLNQLGKTLWDIADQLRGAMNADDYEAAAQKELSSDCPTPAEGDGLRPTGGHRRTPLAIWYTENPNDIADFEKQMRLKVHYVIEPPYLWNSIAEMGHTQHPDLLATLAQGLNYIEEKSFESAFQGLFSEINLHFEKLGRKPSDRNAKLCTIIQKIAEGTPSSAATPIFWAMPTNT